MNPFKLSSIKVIFLNIAHRRNGLTWLVDGLITAFVVMLSLFVIENVGNEDNPRKTLSERHNPSKHNKSYLFAGTSIL